MYQDILKFSIRGLTACGIGLFLVLAAPLTAQAQEGDCANCTDCFTCSGGQRWGVDNCDMGGEDPQCPCRNLGEACNPTVVLAPHFNSQQLVDDLGAVRYVLRLDGSVFGQFDCSSGDLLAVFREDSEGRFSQLPEDVLVTYSGRIHLSNYFDVTGALTKNNHIDSPTRGAAST